MISSKKMFGDFPPNSKVIGIMFCAAYCIINLPVVVSPVNATLATLFDDAKGLPASNPKPLTMLTTPGGNKSPISSIITIMDAGVCSAGFKTEQLPAAKAGANFHVAINNGKFHGTI